MGSKQPSDAGPGRVIKLRPVEGGEHNPVPALGPPHSPSSMAGTKVIFRLGPAGGHLKRLEPNPSALRQPVDIWVKIKHVVLLKASETLRLFVAHNKG